MFIVKINITFYKILIIHLAKKKFSINEILPKNNTRKRKTLQNYIKTEDNNEKKESLNYVIINNLLFIFD